jgi:hypothetical protein
MPTSLNMADILTKALPRETFVRCITVSNVVNPDDILPPIAQMMRGSAEKIYDEYSTVSYSLY